MSLTIEEVETLDFGKKNKSNTSLTVDLPDDMTAMEARDLVLKAIEQGKRSDQARRDAKARQANIDATGGGVVTLNNPSKRFEYDNEADAISDLYKREARGDEQAKRHLKGLWELAIQKLKAQPESFSITNCLFCGKGITAVQIAKNHGHCIFCNADLEDQRKRGWEF